MTTGGDCEIIHMGLLDQPVNALSSSAFLLAAVLLRHRPVLAVLAMFTGVGSFLYHGLGGSLGQWTHDASLIWLILGITYERRPQLLVGLAVASGVVLWALPPMASVIAVAAAVNGAAALLHRGVLGSRRAIAAVAVLTVAAIVNSLSRTGQPWCDPVSVLQGHALWHIGTAAALVLWGGTAGWRSTTPGSAPRRQTTI